MKKKTAVLIVMGIVLAGTLSAQTLRWTAEPAVISGKLALADGVIVVQNGEQMYHVVGFQHLIGFIDGLKEGANVTLEGYYTPFASDFEYQYFIATTLVFNGKTYQLRVPYNNGGMGYNRNMNPWQHHRNMPWQDDRDFQHYRGRSYPRMYGRERW